jgi:phage protein D
MAEPAAVSTLYPALPSLFVDDKEELELAQGITSLLVEEDASGLYRCELTLGNWGSTGGEVGFVNFDRRKLEFGKSLAVEVGSGEAEGRVFEGRITAIEGRFPKARAPELTILAEDRCQDLRVIRRTRTFENTDDATLFGDIAGEHGLTSEIDVQGTSHRVIAQLNQSDLAFMRERARAIDAELWTEGKVLHVQDRKKRRGETVSLTYGKRLHELSVIADLAEQRTSLTVSGWDVAAKAPIAYEAGPELLGAELGDLEAGGRILETTLGKWPESMVHLGPRTTSEARYLAEAHYRSIARRFVTGEGICEGDARLRVGATVDLAGVGPLFEGKHYVVGVRHLFDPAAGLRTVFAIERPGIGGGSG